MTPQIEDFNWNLRHFLDVIGNYQANVNQANPATFQLLEETLDKLGNFFENVDHIEDERNETISISIDESKFAMRRSIFCRICKVCHSVVWKITAYIFQTTGFYALHAY